MLVLHALWDSWLHGRDMPRPSTGGDATAHAAAYGLFIAAVAVMSGRQVQGKLTLAGGGVFDLENRGVVTLSVTRVTTADRP
jgi:hypothetical protein